MQVRNAQLWVHDQDEALAFYVDKLGWEVRSDVVMPELGDFRWLTVSPQAQPDFAVVLMAIPGPPVMDAETGDQVRSLMAKGFAGTVFLTTDDVDGDYQRLNEVGVEFTMAPTDMPYGRDCGLRDPSGNQLRLAQLAPQFAVG
jgi:predicted enzyme related to lactoylglutathione lyase